MIVLSIPIYRRSLFKYNDRADIPNQEGFRFVAKLNNGLEVVATVGKDASGLHVVTGIPINNISGWRQITPNDEQAIREIS